MIMLLFDTICQRVKRACIFATNLYPSFAPSPLSLLLCRHYETKEYVMSKKRLMTMIRLDNDDECFSLNILEAKQWFL